MDASKEKTVAFAGYRTEKNLRRMEDNNLFHVISTEVYILVCSLYEQGFSTFLSGMDGFDMIAARAVLRLKVKHPDVRLVSVIPFVGQEDRLSEIEKLSYPFIRHEADDVILLANEYTSDDQYLRRNDYLLEHSSHLVCYFDEPNEENNVHISNRAAKLEIPITNIYTMLTDYFANTSKAKKALQPYGKLKSFGYCKEGIMLSRINDKPIIIAFGEIADVVCKRDVLCIALRSKIQLLASRLTDDCEIKFPEMTKPTIWQSIVSYFNSTK